MAFETLVSVETLAQNLDDPSWVVFDCRHDLADPGQGERAYRESHIPGARFANLDRKLSGGSWSEWCSDPRRPIAKG